MINVVLIILWELSKTLCMVTVVAKFNNILFKASGKTFNLIQADFNKKICLADENSKEVKAWKEKKRQAKSGEARLTSNCLLLHISTERYLSSAGKGSSRKIGSMECLSYSESRCSSLVKSTQLRWEYAELLYENITEEVRQLMFRLFGKEASQVQINHLTKDFKMDPTHNVKNFFAFSNGLEKRS